MTASKQFVSTNFQSGQLLDTDTMNQINNNTVFVRDQMIDGKYLGDWGFTQDTGLKVVAGRIPIAPGSPDPVYGTIYFPSMFTPTCQPIITMGILSPSECRFEYIHYGIGQYYPDHRGFQFKVKINPAYNQNNFSVMIYMTYIAFGY